MTAFSPPDQAATKALLLATVRAVLTDADTASGSDLNLKMGAIAHVIEGLATKVENTAKQIFPDEATSANLERWANLRMGVGARKDAAKASGNATLTGTDGTPVPTGTECTRNDGTVYETTGAASWDGGGSATVPVQAKVAGLGGNAPSAEALTLSSPITGINSNWTASGAIAGGLDIESDESLLQRLLDNFRNPPAGGTKTDWQQWALAVSGVSEAFALPTRRGLGTCDVAIFTTDASGDRATAGAQLLTDTTTAIDLVRPVTVKSFQVLAPTETAVNFIIDNLVVDTVNYAAATVQDAVKTALGSAALFAGRAPGATLYRLGDVAGAIAAVAGVVDFEITAPASDVTSTVDPATVEVLKTGSVTVNLAP